MAILINLVPHPSNPILEENENNGKEFHVWDDQDGDLDLNENGDIKDNSEFTRDFEDKMNRMEEDVN